MNCKSHNLKQKGTQIKLNESQETIQNLMNKAKMAQFKREQLIIQRQNLLGIKAQKTCSQESNLVEKQISNPFRHEKNFVGMNSCQINNLQLESGILHQSYSYNSSHRPFESNRTLEPYLINIKEEYVCGVADSKDLSKQQKSVQPISNNESIQLSESRQVSQEMLLHNSTTSKFLESPSLSLGLVESKITKKEVESENNTKILRKKDHKHDEFQNTGHIFFVSSQNQSIEHKLPIKIFQQKQVIIKIQKEQVQQKDASQQFPQNEKQTQPKGSDKINLQISQKQKKKAFLSDLQLSNSIMTSYQMEVEYLRKINLCQSLQIQKLRQLIRITENNQSKISQIHQNEPNLSHNLSQNKPNFSRKAIDILKQRQTFCNSKKFIQPLKQKDTNIYHTATSIDNTTEVQFICGDQIHTNHQKSASFSNKIKLTTAETFHSFVKKSNNHHPKSKTKKKPVSIYKKPNHQGGNEINKTFENQSSNLTLNHNSQSFSLNTNQMMNSSIGRHNLSCSTNFMTAKSTTKKSRTSKSTHSQRNFSTIISSSNKENLAPKLSIKNPTKKRSRKQTILQKDMQLFASTKKHAEHLLSLKQNNKK